MLEISFGIFRHIHFQDAKFLVEIPNSRENEFFLVLLVLVLNSLLPNFDDH